MIRKIFFVAPFSGCLKFTFRYKWCNIRAHSAFLSHDNGTTVARFDKAAVSRRDCPFVRKAKINPFSNLLKAKETS